MVSKALLQAVTTPSRICRMVNVRPILTLEIQRNSIDMALISDLADQEDSVQVLDRLKWNTNASSTSRRIPGAILQEVSERIQHHHHSDGTDAIAGMVVGWPIQRDTGKLGGPCGRVLFTLESLMEQHPGTISLHRPLCLWTRSTRQVPDPQLVEEDAWGRCPTYGRTTPPGLRQHVASMEQYAFDESLTATDLWSDFFQVHWPALYRRRQQQKQQQHPKQQQHLLLQPKRSSSRKNLSPHPNGGRPSTNNLIVDWRSDPTIYSEQVAV